MLTTLAITLNSAENAYSMEAAEAPDEPASGGYRTFRPMLSSVTGWT